ncbi:MAG: hypothetical protein MSA93_06020, partial [Spirochaetales bacterium]|nr:hypothetical protein [Spirochaetales bacterium]
GVDVVISDIKTPNGCWDTTSYVINGSIVTGDITINVNEASVTRDINMTRQKYDLGESGISGKITASRQTVFGVGSDNTVKHSLDGLVVAVKVNDNFYSTLTGSGNYDSDTAGSFSVDFSGLAVNEKISNSDNELMIRVFKQDAYISTESDFNNDSNKVGEYKLYLDTNFSDKNNVTIHISDWT